MMRMRVVGLGTCPCRWKHDFETMRNSKILEKIMRKSQVSRPKNSIVGSQWSSLKNAPEMLNFKSNRRIVALNKIVMQHVVDLIPAEDIGEKLHEYGVEVTKVNISPSYEFINIYWMNTRPVAEEEELSSLLAKMAGKLRFQLSALKVMGHVPPIRFVKDAESMRIREIDALLDLVSIVGENGNEDEGNAAKSSQLPRMSQCVLGLDADKISRNIELAKNRSATQSKPAVRRWHEGTVGEDAWNYDKKALSKVVMSRKYAERRAMQEEEKKKKKTVELASDDEDAYSGDEEEYYSGEDDDTDSGGDDEEEFRSDGSNRLEDRKRNNNDN